MNKRYTNEWLDDEKEDLAKTAEALKEQYAKDAERVSCSVPLLCSVGSIHSEAPWSFFPFWSIRIWLVVLICPFEDLVVIFSWFQSTSVSYSHWCIRKFAFFCISLVLSRFGRLFRWSVRTLVVRCVGPYDVCFFRHLIGPLQNHRGPQGHFFPCVSFH